MAAAAARPPGVHRTAQWGPRRPGRRTEGAWAAGWPKRTPKLDGQFVREPQFRTILRPIRSEGTEPAPAPAGRHAPAPRAPPGSQHLPGRLTPPTAPAPSRIPRKLPPARPASPPIPAQLPSSTQAGRTWRSSREDHREGGHPPRSGPDRRRHHGGGLTSGLSYGVSARQKYKQFNDTVGGGGTMDNLNGFNSLTNIFPDDSHRRRTQLPVPLQQIST